MLVTQTRMTLSKFLIVNFHIRIYFSLFMAENNVAWFLNIIFQRQTLVLKWFLLNPKGWSAMSVAFWDPWLLLAKSHFLQVSYRKLLFKQITGYIENSKQYLILVSSGLLFVNLQGGKNFDQLQTFSNTRIKIKDMCEYYEWTSSIWKLMGVFFELLSIDVLLTFGPSSRLS